MLPCDKKLTELEFLGLLNGIVPAVLGTGHVLRQKPNSPATLHHQHVTSSASTLAELAADLAISIFAVRPIERVEPETDLDSNVVLAHTAISCLLAKMGRAIEDPRSGQLFHTDDMINLLTSAATDRNVDRRSLASKIEALIPSDAWSDDYLPSNPMLAGAVAGIAYPVTGVPEDELEKARILEQEVKRELESLGFTVRSCVRHAIGENCARDCADHSAEGRNVDLLVVLYRGPSIRVGHQLKGVADLLGLSLALVPSTSGAISCLFKSKEHGRFFTERFEAGSVVSARQAVRKFVTTNAGLLETHVVHRVERDAWHFPAFFELRDRVQSRLAAGDRSLGPGLITKAMAQRLVSSIDIYSGASITLINAVRQLVGLPILSGHGAASLADLFSDDQLYELDLLISAGNIPIEDREPLLRRAAAGLVAASSDADYRSKRFRGTEDWLGEHRRLQHGRNNDHHQ